jgi:guanine deaminase
MREGERMMAQAEVKFAKPQESLAVNWKEALFLATRGGALALGLQPGSGIFEVGAPFDAQCSKSLVFFPVILITPMAYLAVQIFDSKTGLGTGQLDFFDTNDSSAINSRLTIEMVEKWWCIGNTQNRVGMWVQGNKIAG